jgi:hypothetical protein
MRNKFYLITLLAMAAMLLTACSGAAAAQGLGQATDQTGNPVTRTISVGGVGKVFLTPDIAYVTIGVHTENKDAAEAVAQNNAQTIKVKAALNQLGVADKDIQTTNFSIYPQQQYDTTGKPTGEITYIVDNQLYVKVSDTSKIGDLLDAVVKAGANNIYGIQFDVADRSKAMSEARDLAVKDAQTQAEELAAAAGVTLGEVQTISTAGAQTPVPIYERAMGGGGAMASVASNVPISAGQMVLEVDVFLVYGIR